MLGIVQGEEVCVCILIQKNNLKISHWYALY